MGAEVLVHINAPVFSSFFFLGLGTIFLSSGLHLFFGLAILSLHFLER